MTPFQHFALGIKMIHRSIDVFVDEQGSLEAAIQHVIEHHPEDQADYFITMVQSMELEKEHWDLGRYTLQEWNRFIDETPITTH